MTSIKFPIRFALYDGEGGEGQGEGQGDGGGAGTQTQTKTLTITQAKLDEIIETRLNKEKKRAAAERQELITKLETLQKGTGLSNEEREAFENQIEELRTQNMTAEEVRRRQKEKADKEWSDKFSTKEQEANQWKSRHDSLLIKHAISAAASENKALPQSIPFIQAELGSRVRLVEVKDDEGKATGDFDIMVKIPSTGKDGKPVVLDLNIRDAVKHMRETPEQYGMLFEGTAAGGVGGDTGKPGSGKKVDFTTMTPAQYKEWKKANPNG